MEYSNLLISDSYGHCKYLSNAFAAEVVCANEKAEREEAAAAARQEAECEAVGEAAEQEGEGQTLEAILVAAARQQQKQEDVKQKQGLRQRECGLGWSLMRQSTPGDQCGLAGWAHTGMWGGKVRQEGWLSDSR